MSAARSVPEWVWAAALYIAAVAILYWGVLSGDHGFGWDTIEAYWPDLAFLAGSLRSGEWPAWNPFDRGGYPIAADPQPAMYYPVQWLFAGVGAVTGAGWWLIQLKMLAHHVIAGLTMYAWARSRALPRAAAMVGGLALIASVAWVRHKSSNLIAPLAWVPLLWLAIDRLAERPDWRRAAGAAGAAYLVGTAGSGPGMFYAALVVLPYALLRIGDALATRAADRWRLVLSGGIAVALLAALLCVVVLPAMELTEHTRRAGFGAAHALSGGLPPAATLAGALSPAVGLHDAYAGIAVMMLLACALVLAPCRDRGGPMVFAVCAAAFLLMSMGSHVPLLPWLVDHLPGFELFRISNRYRLPFVLALAPLAAYGAAAIMDARRRWTVTAVVAAVAVAAVVLTLAMDLEPKGLRAKGTAVTLTLIAAVGVAASAWLRRWAFAAVLAIGALTVVDAVLYKNARPVFYMPRPDGHEADRDRIADLVDVSTRWRVYDEFLLEQRAGSRLGIRDFRGYPSGDPLELTRYRDVLKYANRHPEILEAYNVRYLLSAPHHVSGRKHLQVKKPTANGHAAPVAPSIYELRHPAPLAAWYGRVRVVGGKGEVLDAVLAAETADGARAYTVMEARDAERLGAEIRRALTSAHSRMVPGELVSYAPDRVVVRVTAPDDGVVVLNEISYPGWRVRVDGGDAPVLRADYLLRAVAVGPGEHVIEWTFAPRGLLGYRLLWWGGALMLLAAATWPWLLRLKRGWPRRG